MTTVIPESLAEHTPRPGLRSATTAAALPSDLDVRPQMSPRLAASIARFGNPQQPIRARTPTAMPASPTISRDAADAMLHLQRQLDETRAQLALVESNARTAAVQAAANFQQATADLQIQQLRDELARANATLRSPTPPGLSDQGSDTQVNICVFNKPFHPRSSRVAARQSRPASAIRVLIRRIQHRESRIAPHHQHPHARSVIDCVCLVYLHDYRHTRIPRGTYSTTRPALGDHRRCAVIGSF